MPCINYCTCVVLWLLGVCCESCQNNLNKSHLYGVVQYRVARCQWLQRVPDLYVQGKVQFSVFSSLNWHTFIMLTLRFVGHLSSVNMVSFSGTRCFARELASWSWGRTTSAQDVTASHSMRCMIRPQLVYSPLSPCLAMKTMMVELCGLSEKHFKICL